MGDQICYVGMERMIFWWCEHICKFINKFIVAQQILGPWEQMCGGGGSKGGGGRRDTKSKQLTIKSSHVSFNLPFLTKSFDRSDAMFPVIPEVFRINCNRISNG